MFDMTDWASMALAGTFAYAMTSPRPVNEVADRLAADFMQQCFRQGYNVYEVSAALSYDGGYNYHGTVFWTDRGIRYRRVVVATATVSCLSWQLR